MVVFNNVDDINKILRKYLISQSELNSKHVFNSLSTYGKTLTKIFNNIATSYDRDETILLFELSLNENNSNVSFTSNDSIIYNQSYNLKITLYGNESLNLSNKIIARLRTEKIRNSIYDEGIYLEKIENPKSLNEFINDVLWLRTDFNILLSCEFLYSQVEQDNNMENTSSIKLIDV